MLEALLPLLGKKIKKKGDTVSKIDRKKQLATYLTICAMDVNEWQNRLFEGE